MPSSRPEIIPGIVNCLVNFQPKSILDVGCGSGKYGFLARDYLENRDEQSPYKTPDRWEIHIDAIEGFAGYVGSLHSIIYENVFCGDALKELSEIQRQYDLIICLEMIEHCKKEYGRELITMMMGKSIKGVVLSTPVSPNQQPPIHGNVLERHISRWGERDFPAWDKWKFHYVDGGKFLVAIYDKEREG